MSFIPFPPPKNEEPITEIKEQTAELVTAITQTPVKLSLIEKYFLVLASIVSGFTMLVLWAILSSSFEFEPHPDDPPKEWPSIISDSMELLTSLGWRILTYLAIMLIFGALFLKQSRARGVPEYFQCAFLGALAIPALGSISHSLTMLGTLSFSDTTFAENFLGIIILPMIFVAPLLIPAGALGSIIFLLVFRTLNRLLEHSLQRSLRRPTKLEPAGATSPALWGENKHKKEQP